LRNSTAFGFSNNLRLDLVVNDLTYGAYVSKEINLLSDGTPKRPLVHIADICRTIEMILNDGRNMDREIFNVGSDTMNFSIKEIAEIIGDRLMLNTITFGQHDADQRSYELDFSKLNEYFPSYNIKFNLHKGIDDLIYNFNKYKISGSEKRISVLNKLISEKKIDQNLYWT
jgi:nucleoside-diphosphate-sugar epimerase